MKYAHIVVAASLLAATVPATAQQENHQGHGDMKGMQAMPGMEMHDMTPAQKEFHQSMQKMNAEMMQGMMEADAAKSWLEQMIAHHQGAIDMSDVVLKHSKNDQVREAARKTIEQNGKDKKELERILGKE